MATIADIRSEAGFFARISEIYTVYAERFAQQRAFRETLKELSSLSDRELADLGLHRGALRQTAYEATYGA